MRTDLPAGWGWSRLGAVFSRLRRKNTAGITRVLTASGEFGLIDQKEFFNKRVAARNVSGYFHLQRGEFAYNRSSMKGYPFGAIKRLDRYDDGVLSTLCLCFYLRDDAALDSDFATYVFDSDILNDELRPIARVGARAHGLLNVTPDDFMSVSFPLPPLPEQKKIAAILSSVDEAIQATQAVIDQTRRVKEGLLQELLTRGIGHTRFKQTEVGQVPEHWRVGRVDRFCRVSGGATPSRGEPAYFRAGTIPWVKSLDLHGGLITETDEAITERALAETSCKVLPKGAVLCAMYGGFRQIGRTGVLGVEGTTNQAISAMVVKSDVRLLPHFLNFYLIGFRKRWRKIAASSRKDANITRQDVCAFRIAVPPEPEQAAIVARVESAANAEASAAATLDRQQRLKAGLLQDLLTGKVRVSV